MTPSVRSLVTWQWLAANELSHLIRGRLVKEAFQWGQHGRKHLSIGLGVNTLRDYLPPHEALRSVTCPQRTHLKI